MNTATKTVVSLLIILLIFSGLEGMPVPSRPAPIEDGSALAGGYGKNNPVLLARRTRLALIGFALAGGWVLLSGSRNDMVAGAGDLMLLAGAGLTGYTCFMDVQGETPAEEPKGRESETKTPAPKKEPDDGFPELEYGE